ncbi:MarR family transcriptional regulator [Streptomyces sp. NPDC060000]|uniref:MarR family transcriptional regulator n=1 Tax=Streptomyces sp. NPDC060000 TaxID=3347031 RepID=UPI0036C76FFD
MAVVTPLVRSAFLVNAVYTESSRAHGITPQQGQLLCTRTGRDERRRDAPHLTHPATPSRPEDPVAMGNEHHPRRSRIRRKNVSSPPRTSPTAEARDTTPTIELVEMLGLGRSSLTGLVDRTAQRGLVRREPDPRDGRAVRVGLTEAGDRLHAHSRSPERS